MADDILEALSDSECVRLLPKLQMRLKQYDAKQNDTLRRLLIGNIIRDLEDPDKCTPGLYQAALRLLGEEVPMIDSAVAGGRVEEIKKILPFKN